MGDNDTFEVVREATVAAKPDEVYGAIVDFKRWQAWSPWEGIDPDLKRTYSGPASGVGTVYEWKGNKKVGQGRMEVTGAAPSSSVVIGLDFIKPFKASNTTTFTLTPEGDGTHVKWSMVGKKTLATKIMGIFKSMDDLVGKDFEKGLEQLQAEFAA